MAHLIHLNKLNEDLLDFLPWRVLGTNLKMFQIKSFNFILSPSLIYFSIIAQVKFIRNNNSGYLLLKFKYIFIGIVLFNGFDFFNNFEKSLFVVNCVHENVPIFVTPPYSFHWAKILLAWVNVKEPKIKFLSYLQCHWQELETFCYRYWLEWTAVLLRSCYGLQ